MVFSDPSNKWEPVRLRKKRGSAVGKLQFTLVSTEELPATLATRYFEFCELNDVHRTAKRAGNKKVLDEAITVINQELLISQWEPSFCSRFLKMACGLARQ